MRKSNFALRLQPSLLDETRKVAEAQGVALNQLINVALAEKLSALRTESYFAERAARANIPEALRILDRGESDRRPSKATNYRTVRRGNAHLREVDVLDAFPARLSRSSPPCRKRRPRHG